MHTTKQSNYSVRWTKTITQKPTTKHNNTKIQNIGIISTYYKCKSFKHVDLKVVKGMLKISKSEEKNKRFCKIYVI